MKTNGTTAAPKAAAHSHQHWMDQAWPEGFAALSTFRQTVMAAGAVDAKTKAFIQLACVSLLRCKHCVNNTVAKLKSEHKASDREIAEVMMVASASSAGTNLAWAKEVFEEQLG